MLPCTLLDEPRLHMQLAIVRCLPNERTLKTRALSLCLESYQLLTAVGGAVMVASLQSPVHMGSVVPLER